MLERVVIMAGGTGGHVFPALAIARELQNKGVTVSWLGTQKGLEADVVPAAGIPIDWISVNGLRGNGLAGWLRAPFSLMYAAYQAWRAIQKRKPQLVIGMGGFVAGPGGLVAWLCRKPLIIHEQNAIPGLTNRLLSHIATVVFEAFPHAFPERTKAIAIGNPVRSEILQLPAPKERLRKHGNKLRLLVIGGSLGAMALNIIVPKTLKHLTQRNQIDVWHQTGKRHYESAKQNYKSYGVDGRVDAFINDMAGAYAWADLVLCRSGALTVSELAATGVGSILVPYPHAVDDHQTANAQYLVSAGAAELLSQNELNVNSLTALISKYIDNTERVLQTAEAAYSLRKSDSVDQLINKGYEVANV